jgi:hypothetical protein
MKHKKKKKIGKERRGDKMATSPLSTVCNTGTGKQLEHISYNLNSLVVADLIPFYYSTSKPEEPMDYYNGIYQRI